MNKMNDASGSTNTTEVQDLPENPFFDYLRIELEKLRDYQNNVGVSYFEAFITPGSPDYPKNLDGGLTLDHLNYVLPPGSAEKFSSFVFQETDRDLYEFIKHIFGADIALHDSSGYLSNLSVLECLVSPGLPVYYDNNVHASLQMGIRMAKNSPTPEINIKNVDSVLAYARENIGKVLTREMCDKFEHAVQPFRSHSNYFRFKHNNAEHLGELTEKYGPGLVVVDSVYSVHGDIVLDDVIKTAHDNNCVILLDESHSCGGLVSPGSLLLDSEREWNADLISFSTGKGLAVPGGMSLIMPAFTKKILESCFDGEDTPENRDLIQTYFRRAIARIFTNAVPDYNKKLLRNNMQEISISQGKAKLVHETALFVADRLRQGGLKLKSNSPIIFIECGTAPVAYGVHSELVNNGIRGAYFCEPATSSNGVGVRFTLNYDFCTDSEKVERLINGIFSVCNNHDVKCKTR